MPIVTGNSALLAGRRGRVRYGVYALLKGYLGCRRFTLDSPVIPAPGAFDVPVLDRFETVARAERLTGISEWNMLDARLEETRALPASTTSIPSEGGQSAGGAVQKAVAKGACLCYSGPVAGRERPLQLP